MISREVCNGRLKIFVFFFIFRFFQNVFLILFPLLNVFFCFLNDLVLFLDADPWFFLHCFSVLKFVESILSKNKPCVLPFFVWFCLNHIQYMIFFLMACVFWFVRLPGLLFKFGRCFNTFFNQTRNANFWTANFYWHLIVKNHSFIFFCTIFSFFFFATVRRSFTISFKLYGAILILCQLSQDSRPNKSSFGNPHFDHDSSRIDFLIEDLIAKEIWIYWRHFTFFFEFLLINLNCTRKWESLSKQSMLWSTKQLQKCNLTAFSNPAQPKKPTVSSKAKKKRTQYSGPRPKNPGN